MAKLTKDEIELEMLSRNVDWNEKEDRLLIKSYIKTLREELQELHDRLGDK